MTALAATLKRGRPREGIYRYLARRLGQAVLTVFVIIILSFSLVHVAPGDAVDVLAGEFGAASPEYLRQLRELYGLDQPLLVQLWRYLIAVLQLDLGFSFRNNLPVARLTFDRIPATLLLMIASIVFSFSLGGVLGIIAARWANKVADSIISTFVLLFYATPLFWFGLMMIVLFSVKLQLLPSNGMQSIGVPMGYWQAVLDIAAHLIMPAVTLGLFHLAVYTRLMRASMLEIYGLDYVRTARAKGLSSRRISLRHVLPNALLPMVTMLGLQMGSMLGGAVLVETVFGWPGLGRLAFDAILQRDHNLLIGILLISSTLVVIANLVTDLMYLVLDPRIEVA